MLTNTQKIKIIDKAINSLTKYKSNYSCHALNDAQYGESKWLWTMPKNALSKEYAKFYGKHQDSAWFPYRSYRCIPSIL